MKMPKCSFLIVLLSLLILPIVSCQPKHKKVNSKDGIIGTWLETRVETEDGNDKDPVGIPFASYYCLVFTNDSVSTFYKDKTILTKAYIVTGDTLRYYYKGKFIGLEIIEKITSSEMILRDTLVQASLGNQRLRAYYKKKLD